MKGKSILALAVALAMIFSVIPAFGLTASAAVTEAPLPAQKTSSEKALYDTINSDVLFNAMTEEEPVADYSGDNSYNDDPLSKWGWSFFENGTLTANIRTYDGHDTLKLYNSGSNGGGLNIVTSTTVQEGTKGKDYIVIEFLSKFDTARNLNDNNTITIYSGVANGTGVPSNEILKFNYGKDGILPCSAATQNEDNYAGAILTKDDNYVPVRAILAKTSAGTYDIYWRVQRDGTWITAYNVSGLPAKNVADGIGTIRSYYRIANYAHVGFADLKIYAGNYADLTAVNMATVNYKLDGEDYMTSAKYYNPASETDGVTFEEKYLRKSGDTTIYHAETVTNVTDTQDVTIMAYEDARTEIITADKPFLDGDGADAKAYKLAADAKNLIPNGNFTQGMAGWYNGKFEQASENDFTVTGDGLVKPNASAGGTTATAFWGSFKVDPGTYAFHLYTEADTTLFTDTLFVSPTADDRTELKDAVIIGDTSNHSVKGTKGTGFRIGESWTVFEVTQEKPYVHIYFRWHDPETAFGQLGLYKVEAASEAEADKHKVTFKYPDGTAVEKYGFEGNTVWSDTEGTYKGEDGWKLCTKTSAVVGDTDTEVDMTAEPLEVYSPLEVGSYISEGGHFYRVAGESIVTNGKFNYGAAGWTRNAYKDDITLGSNGFSIVDGGVLQTNHAGGADNADSLSTKWPVEAGATYYITLDVLHDNNLWGYFEGFAGSENAKFTSENIIKGVTPNDNGHFSSSEKGESFTSNASSMTTDTFIVTIPEGMTDLGLIIGWTQEKAARLDNVAIQKLEEVELGVELLEGAQVRIGKSYADSIAEDSGLRFIGTVNKEGTLAGLENAEISVKITAAGNETDEVNIPINDYQDADKTIFTAVLTNLKETNYNRVFTATPVVTINGEAHEGTPVSRSIFEVAAGILVDGVEAEVDSKEYKVVEEVLNAYVNAVGVRFEITRETGAVTNENDYNFGKDTPVTAFEVTVDEANGDGEYLYTIKPQGKIKVPSVEALLKSIRINNNNKAVVVNGIDEESVNIADDGTITFKFTVANAVAE